MENQIKKKLRIGILSDSCFLVTGYATIAREIANSLSDRGHEVFFLANNYLGQNLNAPISFEDGKQIKFRVLGQGRENYFKDLLPVYTKLYNLDVLFILFDTFMLYPWLVQLDLSPAKVIFYYPSDGGGGMPLGCDQILRFVHKPIAMAKFGRDQVKKIYGIETDYIPHAVDIRQFYPVSKEEKLKYRQMFGFNQNQFIIGTVARNQGRKMMDRTIKAFALYAKTNPNAILFMHTDPDDAAQVFHMGSLITRYGIQNRVLFSGMKYFKGFDYGQMNIVYNIMDVFLLTTSGEGFGIPIIEAQAAGVPVLITDYTTTRELVRDTKGGLMIDLVGTSEEENPEEHGNEIIDGTITGSWNVERGICSIKDCTKKLKLLENPELREQLGRNGRESIVKNYSWDVVMPQWIKTIEKLGGEF